MADWIRVIHELLFHAPLSDEFLNQYRDEKPPEFSGEEASGRYLDLHAHHAQFQNAPFGSKECEYIAYLSVVGDFYLPSG